MQVPGFNVFTPEDHQKPALQAILMNYYRPKKQLPLFSSVSASRFITVNVHIVRTVSNLVENRSLTNREYDNVRLIR